MYSMNFFNAIFISFYAIICSLLKFCQFFFSFDSMVFISNKILQYLPLKEMNERVTEMGINLIDLIDGQKQMTNNTVRITDTWTINENLPLVFFLSLFSPRCLPFSSPSLWFSSPPKCPLGEYSTIYTWFLAIYYWRNHHNTIFQIRGYLEPPCKIWAKSVQNWWFFPIVP